jgi:hypothetical protein
MEYKLVNAFKYYPIDGEAIDNACTIVFDDEKFNVAKVQRSLATIINGISLKMFKAMGTSEDKKDNQSDTKIDRKEELESERTLEEKITEYKGIGFNLFSFLEPQKNENILKIMIENGCLYYREPNDLRRNDKFLDSLDIKDIYVILGYYFINFTAKQLT